MNRLIKDSLMVASAAAAGYCAYKWMSPSDRREIGRNMKAAAEDMCDVKDDISGVASAIKDTL